MGATNHTPNYNLPQFIGTDKPTWLSDVNGAFSDIDTQMKANATSAAQGISDAAAADSIATSANNKANTLDTQINTPSTGLAAVVSAHTTDIAAIQSLDGTTALPTVSQTLTGGIAEIYNQVNRGSVSVTGDSTDTYSSLLDKLDALIDPTKINPGSVLATGTAPGNVNYYHIFAANTSTGDYRFDNSNTGTNTVYTSEYYLMSSGSRLVTCIHNASGHSFVDDSSSSATGKTITIYY